MYHNAESVLRSDFLGILCSPNGDFCCPKTLNVPRGEAKGNIKVKGKQNSLSPMGPVIKCFVISPHWIEKKGKKSFASPLLTHKFAAISRNTT